MIRVQQLVSLIENIGAINVNIKFKYTFNYVVIYIYI